MHDGTLETIVGAIFLGILAQVLAGRYKLPAILPLLLFGMAAGPFSVPAKLAPCREKKIAPLSGDARDAATYDRAGVERDSHVLALTPNDELNLLIAELVRDEYGVEHPVVALGSPSSEFGHLRQAWVDLLGQRELDVRRWNRRLENGEAGVETVDVGSGNDARQAFRSLLHERSEDVVLLCGWSEGRPDFEWTEEGVGDLERVTLLAAAGARAALEALRRPAENPAAVADATEVGDTPLADRT